MASKSEVDLHSRLPEIRRELDPKVAKAVGAGARLIRDAAKVKAPVRTGALKNSIHVTRRGMRAQVIAGGKKGTKAGGETGVYYGHIVERGSATGSPAQPFMIPAFEANKDRVNDLIAASLRTL